jgi:putative glutamine amidotransferase
MMDLESLIYSERPALVSRLTFMLGGDRDAAEDLAQETFTRAWQRMPSGMSAEQERAWLRAASRNLAVDLLRRRSRRRTSPIEDAELTSAATPDSAAEPDAAREALAKLPAHERFVLLLRFEAGFSHAEIARLLDISEEAARKRVARARTAFLDRYRATRVQGQPLVLLLANHEDPSLLVSWLQQAGAQVRRLRVSPTERELALADGLVFSGSFVDIDSSLYGEAPRALRGAVDPTQDRLEMAMLKSAMALDLPFIGICRGHQLLNILSGGSLYQDVVEDGVTQQGHDDHEHVVHTGNTGSVRRLLGRSALVQSEHHQAVRRVGRQLRVTATSPDGVIETIEREDRRFALGLQWHPECTSGQAGEIVAEALVHAASERAAA